MASPGKLAGSHLRIEITAADTEHRTGLLLADRHVDRILNLGEDSLGLFLGKFALSGLYPFTYNDEGFAKHIIVYRSHRRTS